MLKETGRTKEIINILVKEVHHEVRLRYTCASITIDLGEFFIFYAQTIELYVLNIYSYHKK